MPLGGLAGVAYFVLYLIHDRQTPALLMQYTGVGFWIACFASGFLLLQHFAVRSPSHHARDADPRGAHAVACAHASAGCSSGPRANQIIGSVFRFQFLFGLVIVIVLAIAFSPIRDDANLFLSQRNLSNVARDVSETGHPGRGHAARHHHRRHRPVGRLGGGPLGDRRWPTC